MSKDPLMKGFRDKTSALPLEKLRFTLEELKKEADSKFQSLNETNISTTKYFFKKIQDLENHFALLDYAHSALVKILEEKKIVDREKYNDKINEIVQDKIDKNDLELDKKTNRVVVDRESKLGDIVCIDYEGTHDGKEYPNNTGYSFNVVLGSNSFSKELEHQLVGCKAGDEKEIKTTVKSQDESEDKELVFKVKVKKVKEYSKKESK